MATQEYKLDDNYPVTQDKSPYPGKNPLCLRLAWILGVAGSATARVEIGDMSGR